MAKPRIAVLGIFVADLTFRGKRLPHPGETMLGEGFYMGPGGKGSNQAVAVARLGGEARFISRIGRDVFGETALKTWALDAIDTGFVEVSPDLPTGAAFIFVSTETGNNTILLEPGVARKIDAALPEAALPAIRDAQVFITQLETPVAAALRGLELARQHQVLTIFNPAPALKVDHGIYKLCDFLTPNEQEVTEITGIKVQTFDEARQAGERLLEMGVGTAIITLGAKGVYIHNKEISQQVAGFEVKAVDTTGAGDTFNGAFAVAIAEGAGLIEAARFGCAAAALSVTLPGAANSIPHRQSVEKFLSKIK